MSDIEPCRIILFQPERGLEVAAQRLSAMLGAASLEIGALDAVRAPRARSAIILAVQDEELENLYRAAAARLRAMGCSSIGLVAGLESGETVAQARQLEERPSRGGRPWLLSNERRCGVTADLVELVDPDTMDELTWQGLARRRADFALIIGHGREDILYLGSTAFCGLRTDLGADKLPDCRPHDCCYPQTKRSIADLNANILVLLSCNAGRIGPGLMPASARIGLTAARSCRAVVVPQRLYTHNPALTSLILDLLLAGASAGDVAASGNAFQKSRYGEDDVFILFGDPEQCSEGTPQRSPAGIGRVDDARRAALGVGRIIGFAEACQSLGLAGADIEALAAASLRLEQHFHRAFPPAGSFAVGEELLRLFDDAMRGVADQVALRVAQGYFWLSNGYNLLRASERETACPNCDRPAARQEFQHSRLAHCARARLTCPVCGIAADVPLREHSSIRARPASPGDASLTVEIDLAQGPGYLAIGLNGFGTRAYGNDAIRFGASPAPSVIPLKVGANAFQLSVELQDLRPGIYFLKLFAITSSGVAERSIPLRTWNSQSIA
jgi:hypothetical protein